MTSEASSFDLGSTADIAWKSAIMAVCLWRSIDVVEKLFGTVCAYRSQGYGLGSTGLMRKGTLVHVMVFLVFLFG
jgi:hypothetical protein